MKQLILIAICLFVIKLTIQFTKDSHTKNDKIIEHGENPTSKEYKESKVKTKDSKVKIKDSEDKDVLTKPENTIYIRGLGDFTGSVLNEISKNISEFYGYKCLIEPPRNTNSNMYTSDGSSLETINCIQELKREGKKTIYVTNENLVSGDLQIRGGTLFGCNTIIIESGDYNKGTAIHEIGHTLGLGHCDNPKCVMAIYNDEENTYDFCENCKRKLKR